MSINPISGLGSAFGPSAIDSLRDTVGVDRAEEADAGFGDAIARGLAQVSGLQTRADAVTTDVATGGSAQIQDLMVATTKAELGMGLLVAVRDRALEAYTEVMRLQV